MKTEEEIAHFYSEVLTKKLEGVEELRAKTIKNLSIFIYSCILLLIAIVVICLINNRSSLLVLLVGIGPVIFWSFNAASNGLKEKYCNTFKKDIVGEMINFFDNRLVYSPERGILPAAINISGLFIADTEDEMSDYAEGRLGETFIQFSKICLMKQSNFTGIFMIASFNKNFNGHYMVVPKSYATTIDSLLTKMLNKVESDIPPPIILENPDFENKFTTFGTDQIEARYILTPALMERILDFRGKVNGDVFFSFTRSRLFLAFRTNNYNFFDPDFSKQTNLSDIEQWGRILQLAIGIVEEFGLNTRIWSKQ
jgi:hypothetical protein